MSREEFLHRVRRAAEAGRAYRVSVKPQPDDIGYVGFTGDKCEKFAAEVEVAGGRPLIVSNRAAAIDALETLCREAKAGSALCWKHAVLDRLELAAALERWNIERLDADTLADHDFTERRRRELAAEIGIGSVDYAVAETGSLFLWAKPGHERKVSLLPPVYVAVVEESQIVPDLYDALAHYAALGRENLPSNAVFLTGPSKTGDMELQLTVGVHGPGKWYVIVIRESRSTP